MQAKKTICSDREHIESIDAPGHCVWCDAPLRCTECGVSQGHANNCARARQAATTPPPPPSGDVWQCLKCGVVQGHAPNCPRAGAAPWTPETLLQILSAFEAAELSAARAIALAYDLGARQTDAVWRRGVRS
jgi:hypothetical protein